jgi:hypothetical protein
MPQREDRPKSREVGSKQPRPAAKSRERARSADAPDRRREKPKTRPSGKDGGETRKRSGGAGPARTPAVAGLTQASAARSENRTARERKPRSPDRPGRFAEKAGLQETRNRGDDPRGLSRTGHRAGPRGGGSDDRHGPRRR